MFKKFIFINSVLLFSLSSGFSSASDIRNTVGLICVDGKGHAVTWYGGTIGRKKEFVESSNADLGANIDEDFQNCLNEVAGKGTIGLDGYATKSSQYDSVRGMQQLREAILTHRSANEGAAPNY
jgi:hypothetical protein